MNVQELCLLLSHCPANATVCFPLTGEMSGYVDIESVSIRKVVDNSKEGLLLRVDSGTYIDQEDINSIVLPESLKEIVIIS